MGATLEARKKGGPFLPKWQKVKGSHKALGGKLFLPDIGGAIDRYDQTLKEYDTLLKEQEKLKSGLLEMIKDNSESVDEIAMLNAELTKRRAKIRSAMAAPSAPIPKICGARRTNL